jgi:hypothetical protein
MKKSRHRRNDESLQKTLERKKPRILGVMIFPCENETYGGEVRPLNRAETISWEGSEPINRHQGRGSER